MPTALQLFQKLAETFEGRRNTAYKDPAGFVTIGIGHKAVGMAVGTLWTDAQIDAAFTNDAQIAMSEAFAESPTLRHASPGTQAAVFDFVFNEGIGRYAGSTFRQDIDRGDLAAAKESIMLWVKGTVNGVKVTLPGLVKRRQAEADLIGT